jgi:hypothetical protein
MEALRLNEKSNKGKGKTVKEKEESGMETTLNVFERGGRGRARSTSCMAWWIRYTLRNQQLHSLFNLKIL